MDGGACLSAGPYSVTRQQSPSSCEFYEGSLFTKSLPSDVGSHLATNSNQIIMGIFGNNPANAESGVIAAAARGGAMKEAFYYASASDPIYYFASVSAPPTGVNGNNPQGVYAHFPNQAHESGARGPPITRWCSGTNPPISIRRPAEEYFLFTTTA
jgi:hypothetical protein